MTVFISYARANQIAVEQLRGDVERCHREVWVDRELTGGQSWWRAILQHIRGCDVFMVALSREWVYSKACDLELRYAIALRRPVLPVMVAKIDPRLAPPAIADAQIIDYLQRSPEAMFALRDALDSLSATTPLPSPLPPEPAAPISYRHNIIVMLNTLTLDPRSQYWLWRQLQAALGEAEGDEHAELLELVRRLRKRRDLIPQLYGEIDAVFGPATAPGVRSWPTGNFPAWNALTQIRPTPIRPPPPNRSHSRLLWMVTLIVVVVIASTIGIAAVIANRARQTDDPSVTTTTATTVDTQNPDDTIENPDFPPRTEDTCVPCDSTGPTDTTGTGTDDPTSGTDDPPEPDTPGDPTLPSPLPPTLG